MKEDFKLTCLHCRLTVRPTSGSVTILGLTREQKMGALFDQAMNHLKLRHPDELGQMGAMLAQFSTLELLCHFDTQDEQLKKDRQIGAALVHQHVRRVLTDEDIEKQVSKAVVEARHSLSDLNNTAGWGALDEVFTLKFTGLCCQMRDWLNYSDVLPTKADQGAVPIDGGKSV